MTGSIFILLALVTAAIPLVVTLIVVTAFVTLLPAWPRSILSVAAPPALVVGVMTAFSALMYVGMTYLGAGVDEHPTLSSLPRQLLKAIAMSLPSGSWAAASYGISMTALALLWPGMRERAPWLLTSALLALLGSLALLALTFVVVVGFGMA